MEIPRHRLTDALEALNSTADGTQKQWLQTVPQQHADQIAAFAKEWTGKSYHPNGNVKEIRAMRGESPAMSTWDDKGNMTGHGIV